MKKISLTIFLCLFSACNSIPFIGGDDEEPKPAPVAQSQEAPQVVVPAPPPTNPAAAIPKKRILVLSFANRTPYGGKALGQFAADEIKTQFGKAADFILLSEDEMEDAEHFVSASGNFNTKLVFEKARNVGALAVVLGTIDEVDIQERGDQVGLFQTRYHTVNTAVKYQVFDTATEKAILTKNAIAELTEEHTEFFSTDRTPDSYDASRGQGAISKALEKTYPQLLNSAKRLAWIGKIAKAGFNRYYINAGEQSGITKGQLLKVMGGGGEEVVDKESGKSLGFTPGRFKGILKVVDFFGTDGAVAIVHSGGTFGEQDRVEVFTPPIQ